MKLDNEIIDCFLFCKHKAYLKWNGSYGNKTDYELVHNDLYKHNRNRYLETMKSFYKSEQINHSIDLTRISADRFPRLLVNPQAKGKDFLITFDAIHVPQHTFTRKKASYVPISISPKEKIAPHDKIALATKAILLNRIVPQFPEAGKIIFGKELRAFSIKMKDYRSNAQKLLNDLTMLIKGNDKPAPRRLRIRICNRDIYFKGNK